MPMQQHRRVVSSEFSAETQFTGGGQQGHHASRFTNQHHLPLLALEHEARPALQASANLHNHLLGLSPCVVPTTGLRESARSGTAAGTA